MTHPPHVHVTTTPRRTEYTTDTTSPVTLPVTTPHPDVWVVQHLEPTASVTPEDITAIGQTLAAASTPTTQLLIRDRTTTDHRVNIAHAGGFTLAAEKILVRHDFDHPNTTVRRQPTTWTTRSYADIGHTAFAHHLYTASIDDPFENTTEENAPTQLQELIDYAETAFNPTRWVTVSDDHGPIGVVLPQCVADSPGEGTLFYLGVTPERRREGLGTQLHAFGLELLREAGATHYIGFTDKRNTGMVNIFATNNCSVFGVQSFYAPPHNNAQRCPD